MYQKWWSAGDTNQPLKRQVVMPATETAQQLGPPNPMDSSHWSIAAWSGAEPKTLTNKHSDTFGMISWYVATIPLWIASLSLEPQSSQTCAPCPCHSCAVAWWRSVKTRPAGILDVPPNRLMLSRGTSLMPSRLSDCHLLVHRSLTNDQWCCFKIFWCF